MLHCYLLVRIEGSDEELYNNVSNIMIPLPHKNSFYQNSYYLKVSFLYNFLSNTTCFFFEMCDIEILVEKIS